MTLLFYKISFQRYSRPSTFRMPGLLAPRGARLAQKTESYFECTSNSDRPHPLFLICVSQLRNLRVALEHHITVAQTIPQTDRLLRKSSSPLTH